MATLDGSLPPASAPARPAGARSQSSKRSDSPATARTASRRLVVDRVARWVVTGGGGRLVHSVLGGIVCVATLTDTVELVVELTELVQVTENE